MGDQETKEISNLKVTITSLNGDIKLLNRNFETLNEIVPKLLDKIENQTSFLMKLIEEKDNKYHKTFTRKDINDKENELINGKINSHHNRIKDVENDRKKVFWMITGSVVLALLNLILK